MIIYGNTTLKNPKFIHHCTLSWTDDNILETVAAGLIETFGLPGDKYIGDFGPQWVTWSFRDPKDAVFFKLKFGAAV